MNIALTIAGSDSGGGAGLQADLKTFHQFGVYGTSVVTAVTAQNTLGVTAWQALDAGLVSSQLAAVAGDLRPRALKSGMLGTAAVARAVADAVAAHGLAPYVLDPVMVATSGDRLLDADAEAVILTRLVPLAALVTPNLDEAEILTGLAVRTEPAMVAAAHVLLDRGAGAVLIKGGHLEGSIVDLLVTRSELRRFPRPRIATTSTHGTGCTLSAAVAAGLASGSALEVAVSQALDFVYRAIEAAPGLGSGHGPLNHFVDPRPRDQSSVRSGDSARSV